MGKKPFIVKSIIPVLKYETDNVYEMYIKGKRLKTNFKYEIYLGDDLAENVGQPTIENGMIKIRFTPKKDFEGPLTLKEPINSNEIEVTVTSNGEGDGASYP